VLLEANGGVVQAGDIDGTHHDDGEQFVTRVALFDDHCAGGVGGAGDRIRQFGEHVEPECREDVDGFE